MYSTLNFADDFCRTNYRGLLGFARGESPTLTLDEVGDLFMKLCASASNSSELAYVFTFKKENKSVFEAASWRAFDPERLAVGLAKVESMKGAGGMFFLVRGSEVPIVAVVGRSGVFCYSHKPESGGFELWPAELWQRCLAEDDRHPHAGN